MRFLLYLLALGGHVFFCYRFYQEIVLKIHDKIHFRRFILISLGLTLLTDLIYLIFFVLISYLKIFFSIDAVDNMIYSSEHLYSSIFWIIGVFSSISLITSVFSYLHLKKRYLISYRE